MSSLVREFQKDLIAGTKPATELLRTAKLIAAKLGLDDISEWADRELRGYRSGETIPDYRKMGGGELQILHPMYGWRPAGNIKRVFMNSQPISEVEALADSKSVVIGLTRDNHYELGNNMGMDISHWQQQISFSPILLTGLINAVKDKLLDWAIQLEKRNILGENMTFNQREQDSAKHQTFNIQNFTGILGDVSNSEVQVYDYSTIHQVLRKQNISQTERNDLENILDELKVAPMEKKPGLLQRGKDWIVRNQEFLGATASVVRKALGLPGEESK